MKEKKIEKCIKELSPFLYDEGDLSLYKKGEDSSLMAIINVLKKHNIQLDELYKHMEEKIDSK